MSAAAPVITVERLVSTRAAIISSHPHTPLWIKESIAKKGIHLKIIQKTNRAGYAANPVMEKDRWSMGFYRAASSCSPTT
jgi:hypothetical protein